MRGSSEDVERAHVEVITCGRPLIVGLIAAGAIGTAGLVTGGVVGGVAGWSVAAAAGLVGVVGLVSLLVAMIGRYMGLPWLFTP